jgi:excisionase family DNA binding protein
MKNHQLFSIFEVASYCKVHPNTIYRALRNHELDGIKRRTGWQIPKSAVDAFLRNRDADVRILKNDARGNSSAE